MRLGLILMAVLGLAVACTPTGNGTRPGDGRAVFNITSANSSEIQFRTLDAVNELRDARGLPPVQLSAELIAAAKTHAFDIARQNRPWHFGSDGSSPIDRAARAGFPGRLLGENISETYEDDLSTLNAWMSDASTRATILDPQAKYLGFSWHQQTTGKIWWVMNTGSDAPPAPAMLSAEDAIETTDEVVSAAEDALASAEL